MPLAFLASGAAGLLFEVLWFRALGRMLGNTVWAGTLVLAAFMLGIALGGVLAARWSHRIRDAARAFAIAEITVAAGGSLLVWGLPLVESTVAHWLAPLAAFPATLDGLRLLLAFCAMLIPTIAMGMTLPLGVRVLAHQRTAKALGILYSANTLGACIAPLAAEYLLIGALGLRGTALVAAMLNLLAAALAVLRQPAPSGGASLSPAAGRTHPADRRLLLVAAGAGALALALEVIWFRLLILYAPATETNFALMLTLLLVGIALGGALAPLLDRAWLAWIAAGASFAVVLGYVLAAPGYDAGFAQVIHYALPLMLPAAVFSGCLYILLGAELRADAANPQPAIGRLNFANTLGGALGAALGGFVLLPRVGIEVSLFLLAACYGLLAVIVAGRHQGWRALGPAALALAALALFPFGRMEVHLARAAHHYQALDGSTVVKVIEGPTTTLQILKKERFGDVVKWRLLTDSYSMSGTDRHSLRYMQLFAWLPLALHPEPRRALLISYGAGNTAQALLSERGLEQLTVVDVSPEIVAGSRVLHGEHNPLEDPRARLVLEDGRHYLVSGREQFDLITGEPPPPLVAGVVNLYTREYFAALAERLAPGGLATYWLPVHQLEPSGARAVIAAFCDVFADCTLWSGSGFHWILLGGRGFKDRPAAGRFERLWRDPATSPRLRASGLEHPAQLGATFLADAAQLRGWIRDTPALTDDRPKRLGAEPTDARILDEYSQLLGPEAARRNFETSSWVAAHWPVDLIRASAPYFSVQPILNGLLPPDPVQQLSVVDMVLRNTDLRIPVLWLLGSDIPEQMNLYRRMAEDAPRGGYRPEYAYALGVRALAERDYRTAAAMFGRAAELNPRPAGALAAYAMCRAGMARRAAKVAGAELLAPPLRCWERPRGGS